MAEDVTKKIRDMTPREYAEYKSREYGENLKRKPGEAGYKEGLLPPEQWEKWAQHRAANPNEKSRFFEAGDKERLRAVKKTWRRVSVLGAIGALAGSMLGFLYGGSARSAIHEARTELNEKARVISAMQSQGGKKPVTEIPVGKGWSDKWTKPPLGVSEGPDLVSFGKSRLIQRALDKMDKKPKPQFNSQGAKDAAAAGIATSAAFAAAGAASALGRGFGRKGANKGANRVKTLHKKI